MDYDQQRLSSRKAFKHQDISGSFASAYWPLSSSVGRQGTGMHCLVFESIWHTMQVGSILGAGSSFG